MKISIDNQFITTCKLQFGKLNSWQQQILFLFSNISVIFCNTYYMKNTVTTNVLLCIKRNVQHCKG